jgi:ribonuclease D
MERVANHFLKSDVVGFDIEWKAQASSLDPIQDNLSLIQLANEERIALFQISLFQPGRTVDDLVAPSLKKLLESPDITKAGVSIKADCTRMRKYLDIKARGLFELSYLYKLVTYAQSDFKNINKRSVNLGLQVEEHLGLPMDKNVAVRCSDWTRVLDYHQVQCRHYPRLICVIEFDGSCVI